jgi:hypothetical protein
MSLELERLWLNFSSASNFTFSQSLIIVRQKQIAKLTFGRDVPLAVYFRANL